MKMITSFLFLVLAISLRAEDCYNCAMSLNHGQAIEDQISKIAKTTQVSCKDLLKEDVDEEYSKYFSGPVKTSVIQGLRLQGTAEELKYLAMMLDKKPVDQWSKAKECSTVLCALEKLYQSETTAKRVLNLAKRNGYIIAASKDFNDEASKPIGQLFSQEEIQTIDLAYKRLPPGFSKLKSLDRIKRMPNGYKSSRSPKAVAFASAGYKSPDYSIEGIIVFLSTSFDSSNTWASTTVVHELGHHVDFSRPGKGIFGFSETEEFLKLSDWKLEKTYTTDKNGKKVLQENWNRPETKKFVSDYAGTQPAEDFAEAVAHYMYEPNRLKQVDPAKYEFMKTKVFAGKEYDKVLDKMFSKEDLLKSCMKNSKAIELRGFGLPYKEDYFKNCLDEAIKNLSPTTPEQCELHQDVIKTAAIDQINQEIENLNDKVSKCEKTLQANRASCIDEGDFRKTCALSKCNLPPELSVKIKDVSYFPSESRAQRDAITKKLGPTKMLMTSLLAGLKDKGKVSPTYMLYYQDYFLNKSAEEIKAKLDQEGFKYDDAASLASTLKSEFMQNKSYTKAFDSFQQMVLKNATKSKEKNLELIKSWAQSESLEDSDLNDDLAETLVPFAKSTSLFSR